MPGGLPDLDGVVSTRYLDGMRGTSVRHGGGAGMGPECWCLSLFSRGTQDACIIVFLHTMVWVLGQGMM